MKLKDPSIKQIPLCALIFGWGALTAGCGSEAPDSEAPKEVEREQAAAPSVEKSVPKPSLQSGSDARSKRDETAKPFTSAPEDEIVPVLNPVPPALSEDKVLPEDPVEFRRQTVRALKTDIPKDELLSMIDVVLLINPKDFEMQEVRANILLKQGLAEDAAEDFRLCCEGGRSSCCR